MFPWRNGFLSYFVNLFFRIDPSAVEAQLPGVVDRLEAALAKLEQDGNDQDSWDQISNSFQFLADSAREGTFLGHQLRAGQAEVKGKWTIAIIAGGHDLVFYPPLLFLPFIYPKEYANVCKHSTHSLHTLPRMTSFSDAPTLFYSLFYIDDLEKARTPIGESRAIALLIQIEALNKQRLSHVDIQALRVLANICVDHGKICLDTFYSGRSSSLWT